MRTICRLTGTDHTPLHWQASTVPSDSFSGSHDPTIRVRRAKLTLCGDIIRKCLCHCLQVHMVTFLDNCGIEIQIPSTASQDRTSWVLFCSGKNQYVDNLSLQNPGRARTSSELLLGRFIENPTNFMMLRWSHLLQASGNRLRRKQKSVEGIGDTMRIWLWNIQNHWTKKSFLTLVTRSGQILPPVDTSTEALFLPRSRALSDWYAIVISTKETETAPFIGILQVPN